MSKISVLNIKGDKVSDITLNDAVWKIEPNDAVMFDAIMVARHSQRQGTASTKTRAEVSGGGRKPWKQKGTGRARHGSTRSPIWRHGGITFGPKPRSYDIKQNRKERRLALRSALSYKLNDKELTVLDNMNTLSNKTKDMKAVLANLKIEGKALIVVSELTEELILATRNINNLLLLEANEINVLDLVSVDNLIITEDAVKQIEEVLV
jgi:50S ribosomal protein L4, bacterial/organelle